jgi:hypothetical protein
MGQRTDRIFGAKPMFAEKTSISSGIYEGHTEGKKSTKTNA